MVLLFGRLARRGNIDLVDHFANACDLPGQLADPLLFRTGRDLTAQSDRRIDSHDFDAVRICGQAFVAQYGLAYVGRELAILSASRLLLRREVRSALVARIDMRAVDRSGCTLVAACGRHL